jgi:hypothetical protein
MTPSTQTAGEPVSRYQPLSHRLPAFLDHYGPEKGYALVIEVQDALALRPGLLRLYEAALQAGRTPEEVGLPPLPKEPTLHFQATLLDAQGRVVGTAAALKPILAYKDFEGGETAARQRLVAALGFGGEVLDEDENQDRRTMGVAALGTSPTPPPQSTADAPPATVTWPAEPSPGDAAAAPPTPPEPTVSAQPLEREPSGPQGTQASASPPPAALVAQINHVAKLKGLEAPAYTTAAEARKVLKQLMQA